LDELLGLSTGGKNTCIGILVCGTLGFFIGGIAWSIYGMIGVISLSIILWGFNHSE